MIYRKNTRQYERMYVSRLSNGIQAPLSLRRGNSFISLLLTQLLFEPGELVHGDLLLLIHNLFDTLDLLNL